MCSGEQSLHDIEKTIFTRNYRVVLFFSMCTFSLQYSNLQFNLFFILALPVGKKENLKGKTKKPQWAKKERNDMQN